MHTYIHHFHTYRSTRSKYLCYVLFSLSSFNSPHFRLIIPVALVRTCPHFLDTLEKEEKVWPAPRSPVTLEFFISNQESGESLCMYMANSGYKREKK